METFGSCETLSQGANPQYTASMIFLQAPTPLREKMTPWVVVAIMVCLRLSSLRHASSSG